MSRLLHTAPGHAGAAYWLYHKSVATLLRGDEDDAITLIEKAFEKYQPIAWGWMHLANLRGMQGDKDGAHAAIEKASAMNPSLTVEHYAGCIRAMCTDPAVLETRLGGLRSAGLLTR